MIDAERLDALAHRADRLRQRQSALDERASEHRDAVRNGTWDPAVHQRIEGEYDQLGQDLATLQADLDLLLSEDEDGD